MTLPDTGHLLRAAALAVGIAFAARRGRALTVSGAIAAAIVGFLLFGLGGGQGAAALLLFFVTSSALSRWRRRDKDRIGFEKGGERDASQVLANGGIAAACALLLPVFPEALWPRLALLGALAAANADTWGTEIGALSRRPPRLITTLRPAQPGASGAVSVPGTAAALVGALLVALVAVFWNTGTGGVVAATVGGFAGALADSVLGATVQVQYRCPVCGALTERRMHCDGALTERSRGIPWLANDAVNFVATMVGAVVAVLLFVSGLLA